MVQVKYVTMIALNTIAGTVAQVSGIKLNDWVDWLIGWLIRWMVCWMNGRLVGWVNQTN